MKKFIFITLLIFSFLIGYCYAENLQAPPSPNLPSSIQQPNETQQEQSTSEGNIKAPPKIPGLEPPPSVKLNIPPPKNLEEAVKRINDFKIFRKIVPPGTSPQYLEKTFFGKYRDVVKPYIQDNEPIEPENVLEEIESEKGYNEIKNTQSFSNKVKNKKLNNLKKSTPPIKPRIKKISPSVINTEKELMAKYTKYSEKKKDISPKVKNIQEIEEKQTPSYTLAIILTLIIAGGIGYYFFIRRNQ